MYTRQSNRFPVWLVGLIAMILVFGTYFLWRGFMGFVESAGDITYQITNVAVQTAQQLTETFSVIEAPTFSRSNFVFSTPTPTRPCEDFYVTVVRARVRECPSETCETIERPFENNIICVYGVVPNAPDWYEVNLDPKDPLPRIGYMHNSVIYPVHPTKRPTRTPTAPSPTPLPTVTPIPATQMPPTATVRPVAPAKGL